MSSDINHVETSLFSKISPTTVDDRKLVIYHHVHQNCSFFVVCKEGIENILFNNFPSQVMQDWLSISKFSIGFVYVVLYVFQSSVTIPLMCTGLHIVQCPAVKLAFIRSNILNIFQTKFKGTKGYLNYDIITQGFMCYSSQNNYYLLFLYITITTNI